MLAACLLGSGRARGEPAVVALSFQAPAECGDARAIERGVRELLETPPARPLRATLRISRQGDLYTAELRTEPAQRRLMRARSCNAIVEAAAVILALAIDPLAERRAHEAWRATLTADAAPPASNGARPKFLAGAASALDTSTLPHVAAGASLRGGIEIEDWSGLARFTYWFPASTSLAVDPSLGGRFTWWTLSASGCFAPVPGAPRLELCLGPELGRLEAHGRGADTNRTARATWLGLALEPNLAFALNSRVVLRASAGIVLTILGSHPFVLERSTGVHEVHRPARVSGRAGLGLDLVF